MDSVLARVVLLLLGGWDVLRSFSVSACLFIDTQTLTCENVLFLTIISFGNTGLPFGVCGLNIVEGRGEVNVDVCLDDTDGIILIFGSYF